MKTVWTIFSTLAILFCTTGTIWGQIINEWDWDESGSDEGEFIEVFIADPQPSNLSEYAIIEYETTGGSAGNIQGTHTLDGFTATAVNADGGTYYVLEESFEQHDAVALIGPSGLIQFLHTTNQVTANEGVAATSTSTSIGVSAGYTKGHAVQRQSNGMYVALAETPNALNNVVVANLSFSALPDCDDTPNAAGTAATDNTMYIHISNLANADGVNSTTFTSSSGTVTGNITAGTTSGTIQINGLTDADYGTILTLTASNNGITAALEIPVVICGFSVDNGGNGRTEDDISNGTFCTTQNGMTAPGILVEAVSNTALSSGNDIVNTYVYALVNTSNNDEIVTTNNSGLFASPNVVSGQSYRVYAFNITNSDLTAFNMAVANLAPKRISAGDDILTKSNNFSGFCYSSCWNVAFVPACLTCPSISALTASSPICSGTTITDLTATIASFHNTENSAADYDIEFVYTTTQAANAAAVYALNSTVLGTEDITTAGVTSVTASSFTLPTVTTQTTYYIYARILNATTTIADANCRPFSEVAVIVDIAPSLAAIGTNPSTCNSSDGQLELTLTNVPDGTTYTLNYVDEANAAQTFTNVTVASGKATITGLSTGTYNNLNIALSGCTSTEDVDITLSPPLPTATIALAMPSLCSSSAGTTLTISSDAGNQVIYSIDGVNQAAITIASDGANEIAVNPTNTTKYALVSVTNPTTSCMQNLTDNILLTITNIACESTFPWSGSN